MVRDHLAETPIHNPIHKMCGVARFGWFLGVPHGCKSLKNLEAERCHGRGRGFEPRRPRHTSQNTCGKYGPIVTTKPGHSELVHLHFEPVLLNQFCPTQQVRSRHPSLKYCRVFCCSSVVRVLGPLYIFAVAFQQGALIPNQAE
jgi:hypothetical protein